MSVRIEFKSNPDEDERLQILEPLRAYNASKAGDGMSEKFAFFVRDEETDAVLGGLHGRILYRWMFIELLVVPERARSQKLGSRLMAMAEDFAREQQCIGVWLDTFEFQAPGFYRKQGYQAFGQLSDYPPGHSRLFFQKRLDTVNG
ncbi:MULTISPECIES: GNAT family N-acetyltransferase [unclassified Pseudomonas]|uniref:GNAT family N-acetyltransferase n=1 Tax=unclassified Pseudomonas TaxID=196821 RepID=UPI000D3D1CEB|nr:MULTISPECIES: GNAT family N-acetyltransferase [unclassified Pseudomonas]RAU45455.1 GNAT family N-acetyltransferase [Pseudomonas sp. RIT 409]RAU53161.1 GNAT family N-acetyltransferase [Pseudomonas sp. RIT 412]